MRTHHGSPVNDNSHHEMPGMQEGFNKHEGHNVNVFAKKFWISLVLTFPVIVYSDLPRQAFRLGCAGFSRIRISGICF